MSVYPGDLATDPRKVADAINALSARVEALEAAQLEQAESHRFCVDAIVLRVGALEAAQHAHADLSRLSDAEREQVVQDLASPAAWRPLDVETTYGSEHAADSVQMTHPRMVVEGTFKHGGETYRYKANATPERNATTPEPHPASPEAQPAGGLVERVANAIYNVPHSGKAEARAAIREVAAAALQMHPDKNLTWERVVLWLEREAGQ
jgi:hypothetical protein